MTGSMVWVGAPQAQAVGRSGRISCGVGTDEGVACDEADENRSIAAFRQHSWASSDDASGHLEGG